jgi:hypothetical protein
VGGEAGEIRRDRLGRRINPRSLENLNLFPPGVSGNPGGSYRSRPFQAAIARCAELPISELAVIHPTDTGAVAVVKGQFRESTKGKTEAAKYLTHTLEGTPTQRMQYENVPGTTFAVDQKVSGEVKVEVSHEKLLSGIREIYGLSGHTYVRKSFVAVSVSEGLDQRRLPPKDSDKGSTRSTGTQITGGRSAWRRTRVTSRRTASCGIWRCPERSTRKSS